VASAQVMAGKHVGDGSGNAGGHVGVGVAVPCARAGGASLIEKSTNRMQAAVVQLPSRSCLAILMRAGRCGLVFLVHIFGVSRLRCASHGTKIKGLCQSFSPFSRVVLAETDIG
jgi:hypothetical protein